MSETLRVIRIPGRSADGSLCGRRFPNPAPDVLVPAEVLTCTREPRHRAPCVAYVGDLPVAIAFDPPVPDERPEEAPEVVSLPLERLADEIAERARLWTNESEAAILEEIAHAARAAARASRADTSPARLCRIAAGLDAGPSDLG